MSERIGSRCLLLMTGALHTVGGIAAVNRLVITALIEAGYRVDALSLLETDSTIDARYVLDAGQLSYRVFAGNKTAFTAAAARRALFGGYHHIIVDHVNIAAAIAPLARLGLCRYIVWLFGVEVFPPRPNWEGDLGLRNAHRRFAISDYTRRRVAERYPDLPAVVCDLALDPVHHTLAAGSDQRGGALPQVLAAVNGAETSLSSEVILHVGRMAASEQYKGQDTLIRSFPLIRNEHPGAQLVFVGGGDDFPRLRDLALELSPADQAAVFFAGCVDDLLLARLYQLGYVFAMPSTGEGLGLVYLEAMSHGKACLAGKVDASPCVVRDGITGVLVDDPTAPGDVARALSWMLSHPSEVRQMGRNGESLVRSYYQPDHFRRRFLSLLGAA